MEWIGIFASIIVLISFLFNNIKIVRIINIIGCLFFVIYGININAFSVWFLNGTLAMIHIVKLINNE